jgi:pilus assembly protein CpaE
MINSIIENGEFDFVICDTGNNTRDSTTLALEKADIILMVVTQDVSTVDSNISFIKACEGIGLGLDKVRLVINRLISSKHTGITVDDIEKQMHPYKCIARIKNEDDVTYANNNGVPLVCNEKHPYTRQISDIANYIAGDNKKESTLEKPKKKGFFSKK